MYIFFCIGKSEKKLLCIGKINRFKKKILIVSKKSEFFENFFFYWELEKNFANDFLGSENVENSFVCEPVKLRKYF